MKLTRNNSKISSSLVVPFSGKSMSHHYWCPTLWQGLNGVTMSHSRYTVNRVIIFRNILVQSSRFEFLPGSNREHFRCEKFEFQDPIIGRKPRPFAAVCDAFRQNFGHSFNSIFRTDGRIVAQTCQD